MSRWISAAAALALGALCAGAAAQARYPGVGRAATPAEIAAWDIDVRADFRGLPPGSGGVAKGTEVWEAKCASCHGSFGESNAMSPPIMGGVTREDIARGRVAALARPGEQRSTLMKLSQLSTLWDYINRAMPWNAAKTLSADEVYALTAYILNQDGIVPADFVLSERNIAEIQKRLPNRDGMTRAHGLWDTQGRPDVKAGACMNNCGREPRITSQLPATAAGFHGDLAQQDRLIGLVRGNTLEPVPAKSNGARALAEKSGCLVCHAANQRVVGPSLAEIASRYRADNGADARLAAKVVSGGQGVWGSVPMPPNPQLQDQDVRVLVRWMLATP